MSRTIAHLPWDVARLTGVSPTREEHDHRDGLCHFETIEHYQQRFGLGPHNFGMSRIEWQLRLTCRPTFSGPELWRYFNDHHPPRDVVRLYYTKPARQRARRDLQLIKRQYNTYGETDVDVEPYRPRHSARWDRC